MSVRRSAGVVAALAAAVSLFTAIPAHAVVYDVGMFTTDAGDKCGWVGFKKVGDVVGLQDHDADGYSVVLDVWDVTTGDFRYHLSNSKGNGGEVIRDANDGFPYDLPEGHKFRFEISCYDGDTGDYKGFNASTWTNIN